MNQNFKKAGIIFLFILGVGLFSFFLYYFFFRPVLSPQPAPTNTNQSQTNGQLNTSGNGNGGVIINQNQNQSNNTNGGQNQQPTPTAIGQVTQTSQITNNPVYFVTKGSGGELYYYDNNTGKFYRVSADGTITSLSDRVFYDVKNVVWSNSRQKAILEYPDGSKILFDFTTGKQTTLQKHWQDFSFSPSDQKIAFKSIGLDKENHFLTIANADGSQAKAIENIDGIEDNIAISWSPNNQMVATIMESKDLDRSEIYFVGLNKENFKSMTVEGRGFEGEWTPQGDKMVYSVYNSGSDYKPQLWVADATSNSIGSNRKNLDIQTWADKCSFGDANKLYCAVPQTLEYGASIDRDQTDNSTDQIYEINLETGTKTLIATPDVNHTISQIIINSGYLFFTDKNTNKIYKINLP